VVLAPLIAFAPETTSRPGPRPPAPRPGPPAAAASNAPPESRAEVLAGFFLRAYVGVSVPVIALGVATEYVAARDVMLVFVVLAAAVALTVRAVLLHASRD
jgi:hypothetical protein